MTLMTSSSLEREIEHKCFDQNTKLEVVHWVMSSVWRNNLELQVMGDSELKQKSNCVPFCFSSKPTVSYVQKEMKSRYRAAAGRMTGTWTKPTWKERYPKNLQRYWIETVFFVGLWFTRCAVVASEAINEEGANNSSSKKDKPTFSTEDFMLTVALNFHGVQGLCVGWVGCGSMQ